MLTDDDLTNELRAAFQSATADLRYTGRTRPARTRTVVLPVVVTAGFAAAAAVGVAATGGHHRQAPLTVVGPAVHPSAARSTKLVTKTMKLAGYTLTYQTTAGDAPPVYAVLDVPSLPDGVQPIQASGTEAQAWIGTDPGTGNNTLYVKAPTRNDGNLFALESPSWSQDQLIDLFQNGAQVAVPAVSAHHSG